MKLLFLVIVCTCGVFLTIDVNAQPLTTEKSTLGKRLFFDKRLSHDGTVSCATCHDPASAFASGEAVAIGVREQKGTRNAPTLLNSAFSKIYFWDGRAATLEEQAKHPLLNPSEMGMKNEAALVERVSAIDEYRKNFQRVFPREGITLDTIAIAIAAFERTLVSNNSPFDRFISGDRNAISAAQKRGWELFKGKAACIECHSFSSASPFFTDFKFYNTGIGFTEPGRYLVTKNLKDIGAFKTPALRDIELTRPYMHNGSVNTLLDVVKFYNQGGEKNPNLNEKLRPLNLSDEEMSELVEFMRALTSDAVLRQVQSSTPQNRDPAIVSPAKVVKTIM